MKKSIAAFATLFTALSVLASTPGQQATARANADLRWHAFPDNAKFKVLGLHWFEENKPELWRMPAKDMNSLPKGVQGRSKCPSGGRILLRCTTTRLAVRAVAANGGGLRKFDVYVNGQPCQPAVADKSAAGAEQALFRFSDDKEKEIVIYLPHVQEVRVTAIGVDAQTQFAPPEHRFARPLPVVFYGSSVCQGSGALNPGQTYEAILCRELNLDFVNLGFGGAGKAETNVVDLVNVIPASCFAFDLGKSYGAQDATAFKTMLQTIRRSHPHTPVIVMTPITSIKEVKEADYSARSIHTRTVMRDPLKALIQAGEKQLHLVEGEDLLGFKEHHALSKDGVHPSDRGYDLIAKKLSPLFRQALGL